MSLGIENRKEQVRPFQKISKNFIVKPVVFRKTSEVVKEKTSGFLLKNRITSIRSIKVFSLGRRSSQ